MQVLADDGVSLSIGVLVHGDVPLQCHAVRCGEQDYVRLQLVHHPLPQLHRRVVEGLGPVLVVDEARVEAEIAVRQHERSDQGAGAQRGGHSHRDRRTQKDLDVHRK